MRRVAGEPMPQQADPIPEEVIERYQGMTKLQLIAEIQRWRRQCLADKKRWTTRLRQQIAYTNTWHGRYEVLRHENNKLRRKVREKVIEG